MWVNLPALHINPYKLKGVLYKNSRNKAISGVSWSCYPDLNWRPHPYQRRRKNFFNHKHHKTKNFRRTIQLLRCQEIATGGPSPLFFHALQRFSAPGLIPCPAGHTSDAIPTGTASQGFDSPSAGDCMERNQPLAPPCTHAPTTARLSFRGGPPLPKSYANQP